jgi:hypothetical protein
VTKNHQKCGVKSQCLHQSTRVFFHENTLFHDLNIVQWQPPPVHVSVSPSFTASSLLPVRYEDTASLSLSLLPWGDQHRSASYSVSTTRKKDEHRPNSSVTWKNSVFYQKEKKEIFPWFLSDRSRSSPWTSTKWPSHQLWLQGHYTPPVSDWHGSSC